MVFLFKNLLLLSPSSDNMVTTNNALDFDFGKTNSIPGVDSYLYDDRQRFDYNDKQLIVWIDLETRNNNGKSWVNTFDRLDPIHDNISDDVFTWNAAHEVYAIYGSISSPECKLSELDLSNYENYEEIFYHIGEEDDEGISEVSAPTICSTYFVDNNITTTVDVNVFKQDISKVIFNKFYGMTQQTCQLYVQHWARSFPADVRCINVQALFGLARSCHLFTEAMWDDLFEDYIKVTRANINVMDRFNSNTGFDDVGARKLTHVLEEYIRYLEMYSHEWYVATHSFWEHGDVIEHFHYLIKEKEWEGWEDVGEMPPYEHEYIDWIDNRILPQGLFNLIDENIVQEAIHAFEEEHKIIEDMKNTMSVLREMADAVKDLDPKQVVNDVKNSDVVKTFKKDFAKGFISVVAFTAACINYTYDRTNTNLGLVGIAFGAVVYTTDILKNFDISAKFLDFLTTYFGVSNEVSPQSGDAFVTGLSALLGTYLHSVSGLDISKSLIKGLKDLIHVKRGVSEIVEALIIIFEKGVNYVRRSLLGKPDIRLRATCSIEIDFFLDSVEAIMTRESTCTLYRTKENFFTLCALRDEGHLIITKTRRSPELDGALSLTRTAVNNVIKLIKQFEQQNICADGARQEPVGVLLKGGTGVAKSIVMEHVASAFCALTLEEVQYEAFLQNRKEFIFNHQPENIYFDGYKPTTHVTFIDEIFQIKDVAGKPDGEPMQCLRMLNGFEMSLHMAELENKGHIKFNSKMVCGTTNCKSIKPESIVDATALVRRFPISVIVCPADEYCEDTSLDIWNRKFDFSKLPKAHHDGHEVTKLLPEYQQFWDSDVCGNPIGEPFSFKVLMERIHTAYLDRKLWHQQNLEAYNNTRDEYRRKRNLILDDEIEMIEPQAGRMAQIKMEMKSVQDPVYCGSIMIAYDEIMSEYKKQSGWDKISYSLVLQLQLEKLYEKDSIPDNMMDKLVIYIADVGPENAVESFLNFKMYENFMDREMFLLSRQNCKTRAKLPFTYEDIGRKRYFPSIKDSICTGDYPLLMQGLRQYSQFIKGGLAVGAVLLGIPLVTRMVKAFIPSYNNDPQSFSHSDKMRATVKGPKQKNFGSSAAAKKALTEPQAGEHDQNGIDIAKSVVGTNLFYLYTESHENGDFNFVGNVLFVKGRIAIMPYHFINQMLYALEIDPSIKERTVKLKKSNVESDDYRDVELVCTVGDVIMGHDVNNVFASNDLCLVEFPKQMNEKRNILDYIGVSKELERFEKNIPFVLMNASGHELRGIATATDQVAVCGTDTLDPYVVRSAYSYYGNCIQGSCGSVFFILNPQIPRHKIFGIHVAGNAAHGTGYSASFTREEIDSLLSVMPEQVDVQEMENVIPQSGPIKHTQFIKLGVPIKQITQGNQTSIVKSQIHGAYKFKPLTAPSRLKPFTRHGVFVDPMDLAKNKYIYSKKFIPYSQLTQTTDAYFAFLKANSKYDVEKRLFNWDECLFGIETDCDVNGVKTKSSSGFKLKFEDVDLKKLLNENKHIPELKDKTVADIVVELEKYENMYKLDQRPFWVYIDCLKDERRALEKILAGKTRLFSACEFYYHLLFLKYFGSFLAWMQKNRIDNHCGVGVNPYSLEWNTIAQKLKSQNHFGETKVGAGDYSHFDGSENEQIHLAILDIINRWYDDGESNCRIRYLLWQEIVNSKHVSGDLVYEWNGGMPSGNPATTIINCMYNEFAFRLCWCRMGLDPFLFSKYVYAIFYGDDNLFSVHPKFRDVFNEISLAKYMKDLGLEYTTELKMAATVPMRNLDEVEFLKRSFVFDKVIRRWIAPLRLDVVLEIPSWTSKTNGLQITVDNIKCSLRELALYDRDTYEIWRNNIVRAFERNVAQSSNCEEFYLSHQEMRRRTFDSDLVFH